ncbi:hypothetical protein [Nonomuraea recticatena]|uniref:hypothetical protein n=1 Tax=Nonomuraea recticatena TaxID=46178 RepID=UPI0031F9512E
MDTKDIQLASNTTDVTPMTLAGDGEGVDRGRRQHEVGELGAEQRQGLVEPEARPADRHRRGRRAQRRRRRGVGVQGRDLQKRF